MDVDAATTRWKTALCGLGLPDTLEPTQLKEVSQRSERIAGIHIRLEQLQLEFSDRSKELTAITNRIDQVLGEIGVTYQTSDPAQRLQQLKAAIQQQRRVVAQRKELRTKYLALRSQFCAGCSRIGFRLGTQATNARGRWRGRRTTVSHFRLATRAIEETGRETQTTQRSNRRGARGTSSIRRRSTSSLKRTARRVSNGDGNH